MARSGITNMGEVAKSLAEAIGHEGVKLDIKLNAKTILATSEDVRALGDNPRLEVSRSATTVQPGGAADTTAAAAPEDGRSALSAGTQCKWPVTAPPSLNVGAKATPSTAGP